MIYLIGGAPRSGKTILSKRIAQKNGIPWISTDTIRSIVLACTPKACTFLRAALEIEEDITLLELVEKREKIKGRYVPHNAAWV